MEKPYLMAVMKIIAPMSKEELDRFIEALDMEGLYDKDQGILQ